MIYEQNMPKTILISGGTKGIGKATVSKLLKEGFNVTTFSSSKQACDDLSKENKKSKRLLVMQANMKDARSLEKVVQETKKKFGAIDILLNNAGFGYFTLLPDADMQKVDDMWQVNVKGLMELTRLTVPYMNKKGLIINVASISGKTSFMRSGFYSATKHAVMGFSTGLRIELKDKGIKVCTICPGMIATSFFNDKEIEHRKKMYGGNLPVMLQPKDIAKIISFICNQSEQCDIQDLTVMPFG